MDGLEVMYVVLQNFLTRGVGVKKYIFVSDKDPQRCMFFFTGVEAYSYWLVIFECKILV